MATYTESFDSIPSMTTYGTTEPGQPSIVSGEMQFVAKSSDNYWSALLDDSPSVSDFDATFYLTVGSTANEIYSYFWYRTPTMNATPTTAKYRVQVNRSGAVNLYRESTSLASTTITANTKTKFRLLVSGSSHKVYIDDVLTFDVSDATYSTASKVGIGNYSNFSAFGRNSKIDALSLSYSASVTATVSIDSVLATLVYCNIDSILQKTGTISLSLNASISVSTPIDVSIDAVLLLASQMALYYVNKDQNNFCKVAQYITDVQDLESNKWKHLKSITAVGDYGTNSIKLAWTKHPDYDNWSDYYEKTPTDPSVVQATRWYNLGQAKRFAFDIQWVGNSNIEHNAIEVRYNIRTK